jgi:hypothetical protein
MMMTTIPSSMKSPTSLILVDDPLFEQRPRTIREIYLVRTAASPTGSHLLTVP